MIEVENLSASYESLRVLRNISLKLGRGESVSILGGSGSGKSTLLDIVAGVSETMVDGRINVDATKIGYCFQDSNLIDGIRTVEHIYLTATSDQSKFTRMIRAAKLAQSLNLTFRDLRKLTTDLSGGETQRTALATALYRHNDVILLDEPTSSLDVKNRNAVWFAIRKYLKVSGASLILATHDLAEAILLTDKSYLIDQDGGIRMLSSKNGALDATFSIGRVVLTDEHIKKIREMEHKILSAT